MIKVMVNEKTDRAAVIGEQLALGNVLCGVSDHVDESFMVFCSQEESRMASAAAEIESATARLAAIDAASIRSIREYLAAKEDAPLYLKDYEAQATAERAVLNSALAAKESVI